MLLTCYLAIARNIQNMEHTRGEMETGKLVVERVRGKSTVTRCFSMYPLKSIIPRKVGSSQTGAVWIYTLTYGGGIVSGDSTSCDFTIGDGCTAVLTTQASTKVYKCVASKCSEQISEARIGSDALLVVITDPVTCFSTAKYSQKQVFRVMSDSSLLIVDWITSGRHESGERWDFGLYKSTNHIYLEGDEPLFLDTVLLEHESIISIAEHMQDYQVIAMVILLGPKLKHVQDKVKEDVKNIMSEQLQIPATSLRSYSSPHTSHCLTKPSFIASCSPFGPKVLLEHESIISIAEHMQDYQVIAMVILLGPKLKHVQDKVKEDVKNIMSKQLHIPATSLGNYSSPHTFHCLTKPSFIASCIPFGPKGTGIVIRIAAMTTESVYRFLQHELANGATAWGVAILLSMHMEWISARRIFSSRCKEHLLERSFANKHGYNLLKQKVATPMWRGEESTFLKDSFK